MSRSPKAVFVFACLCNTSSETTLAPALPYHCAESHSSAHLGSSPTEKGKKKEKVINPGFPLVNKFRSIAGRVEPVLSDDGSVAGAVFPPLISFPEAEEQLVPALSNITPYGESSASPGWGWLTAVPSNHCQVLWWKIGFSLLPFVCLSLCLVLLVFNGDRLAGLQGRRSCPSRIFWCV